MSLLNRIFLRNLSSQIKRPTRVSKMSSPTKSKSSISPLFLNEETKPSNIINKQQYDSFLVLDFEATCDDQIRLNPQVSLVILHLIALIAMHLHCKLFNSSKLRL